MISKQGSSSASRGCAAAGLYLAALGRVALRRLGAWRRDDPPDAEPLCGLMVAAHEVRGGVGCGRAERGRRRFPFAAPRELPEEEARAEAQQHYSRWFESAGRYLSTGLGHTEKGWSNEAAFELHQAAERLYHCALLVLTLYSPKSHKLNFLRSQAEQIEPSLVEAWPRQSKSERRCFELLREAYVNARYPRNYTITDEQLGWLGDQVGKLQELVKAACERRSHFSFACQRARGRAFEPVRPLRWPPLRSDRVGPGRSSSPSSGAPPNSSAPPSDSQPSDCSGACNRRA